MKKRFLKMVRGSIKKQYPDYTKDKLDEIMYGIEGLYLTFTKAIIIFAIAFILGVAKELLFLLIAFNLVRHFAFGMHANSSWICLALSSSVFLGCSLIVKILVIPKYVLFILYIITFILILLYAPADTLKRPLINKKKRNTYKIISLLIVLIYFLLSLFINSTIIINCLIIGALIECFLIIPITYKVFKMPYNNYKTYGLNTSK